MVLTVAVVAAVREVIAAAVAEDLAEVEVVASGVAVVDARIRGVIPVETARACDAADSK